MYIILYDVIIIVVAHISHFAKFHFEISTSIFLITFR